MKITAKEGLNIREKWVFKISIGERIFLRNTKNGHFEPKSDKNQNNNRISERQSDDNDIKNKAS